MNIHLLLPKTSVMLASALTALALFTATPSYAAGQSEVSELSLVPIALSVVLPAMGLAAAAEWVVDTTQVSAKGTVLTLKSAADGAAMSVTLPAQALAGTAVSAGQTLKFSAVASGWLLIAGSTVVALIPSALGKAMFHNERITR